MIRLFIKLFCERFLGVESIRLLDRVVYPIKEGWMLEITFEQHWWGDEYEIYQYQKQEIRESIEEAEAVIDKFGGDIDDLLVHVVIQ